MSSVIRIIHAADFHLGSPFSGLSESKSGIRKAEQQDTFMRIIDMCKEQRTHILLLAGDVFDAVRVSSEHNRFFIDALNSIPNTRVFIAPGNHDPYLYSSVYQSGEFGGHVHIFSGEMTPVYCEDLDVVVWGAAFSSSRKYKSLWPEGFRVQDTDLGNAQSIHIVVMHGDIVSGMNEKSSYNPIRVSDIEYCGADYVALGHVHARSLIQHVGQTSYAYAGCPEGRGFDESGPRGVFIGEIKKGRVMLEPIDINSRNYYLTHVDVTGCDSQQTLYLRVKDYLLKTYGSDFDQHAYRVTLFGEIPEDFIVETSGLRAQLERDVFNVRVYDQTQVKIEMDRLRQEKSLRGAFVEHIARRIDQSDDEAEQEQYMRALSIGLKAFEGGVLYREDA